MPKLREVLCEVCYKPIPMIEMDVKYRDDLKQKLFRPADEFERQAQMTPQEVEEKTVFLANLFAEHDAKKAEAEA